MFSCSGVNFNTLKIDEIKQYLNIKAEKYIERTSQMANEMIAMNQGLVYEGPVIIREYHYYDNEPFSLNFWGPRRSKIIVVGDNETANAKAAEIKRIEKNKDDAVVAVIAGIVAACALYLLNSSINLYQDANTELSDSKLFKREVVEVVSYENLDESKLLIETMKIVDIKDKMCERIKASSTWDIALRTTLLATSSFTLGSYFLKPSFMPIGVCGSAFAGIGMLLKAVFDDTTEKNTKDAYALKQLITEIQTNIA